MGRTARKLFVKLHQPDAALAQRLADLLVEQHVRAAELVDRLLRIAHHEQLAGLGRGGLPARLVRIGGGQQQQDLRLQRVGILEFVHEDVGEALLQVCAAPRASVAHEIARQHQQVDEIELAGAALELLVAVDHAPHLGAQRGRQIGIGAPPELLQREQQFIPPRHHVDTRHALGERAGALCGCRA